MKNIKGFIGLLPLAGFLLFSCQNQNQEKSPSTASNEINAGKIDSTYLTDSTRLNELYSKISGKYFGILPCADCSGIETSITIKENGSYIFDRTYLVNNQRGNKSVSEGQFKISGDEKHLVLPEMLAPNRYLIEEKRLTQLDIDGKLIEGELKNNYILNKQ